MGVVFYRAIVACTSVGCHLNLKRIAQQSKNSEYNPKRFAPLIMRLRKPRATGLIFASGKIVITGTRSERDCKLAKKIFGLKLCRLGYRARPLNFEIQNISASCKLGFSVRLKDLATAKYAFALRYVYYLRFDDHRRPKVYTVCKR